MVLESAAPTSNKPVGEVGKPVDRVDGKLKVTGKATYAAEAPVQGVVHGVLVGATIAKGKIADIDTSAAEKSPGVLAVITHKNIPPFAPEAIKQLAENRFPLGDDVIHYAGQYIAVVVADTVERARTAAALVKATYAEETPVHQVGDPNAATPERPPVFFGRLLQFAKGDPKRALSTDGVVTHTGKYATPTETHNPMEMSATVAAWEGEGKDAKLTIWDATQAVVTRRTSTAALFGLKEDQVRVLCPFVGGGFGCKGDMWPHAPLAAAAAKVVGKPVKIMLTRQQMFVGTGHRPPTIQDITLAAKPDGTLVGLTHETAITDSPVGHFVEPAGLGSTAVMYDVKDFSFGHALTRTNIASATFMRAPGENPGMFALETAVDELCYKLKIDPIEFRRKNYAKNNPVSDLPYSTMNLPQCFDVGAEKFGWAKRSPAIGSMKTPDGKLVGHGMATATYPGHRFPNQARIRLMSDGAGGVRAVGQCATQDLGTGAYTVCTQMTAMLTGLPLDKTKFELGDSTLPPGGVSGGSSTTAGVGQALSEAADKLKAALLKLADGTPVAGLSPEQVSLKDGKIVSNSDPSKSADLAPLVAKSGRAFVEGLSDKSMNGADKLDEKQKKFTFQSFGVHFVEVQIDRPVPLVRVTRVVSVMDIGRVINPKTARSQVLGGVVMGIGQALMEETHYDPRTARPVTDNLADYPVCVNPDVHDIDVTFLGEPDLHFNAIGCRGVGEIGITGIAAAIGNAVYHATGRRIRELPITPDKLL